MFGKVPGFGKDLSVEGLGLRLGRMMMFGQVLGFGGVSRA